MKRIIKQKKLGLSLITGCILFILCQSCSTNEDILLETKPEIASDNNKIDLRSDSSKTTSFVEFAKILSKIIYENKGIREFLKSEALKKFDHNNDILWIKISDEIVNGKTIKQIFEEKSSVKFIATIEKDIPLLNVLFPEIFAGKFSAKTYNPADADLPVILLGKNKNYLFFNGSCTDTLSRDEVPCFNVLILNENSRVKVNTPTRANPNRFSFISPIFDNTHHLSTRTEPMPAQLLGQRAIDAYKYFYSPDGGAFSQEYQRDYIYLNITPQNPSGHLIGNVSEYINFIEVKPNMYASFADQEGDAILAKTTATKSKCPYTEEELAEKFWTKGSYVFHILVSTSKQKNAFDVPIVVSPSDLWDFHIETWKSQHKTGFRHSKYTSRIDLSKFTAKPYYIDPNRLISLGKWDISTESMERYVSIYESDESEEIITKETYEFTDFVNKSVDGSLKGTYNWEANSNVSGEVKYSQQKTTKVKKTYEVTSKVNKESDRLGNTTIYYNDPIVEGEFFKDFAYWMHTYSIGGFTFGITAF